MLTKDILSNGAGTKFRVIARTYRPGRNEGLSQWKPDMTSEVTLVSTDKYTPVTGAALDIDHSAFTVTTERTFGFKVFDGERYWVAKPAAFLALASEYDAYWEERLKDLAAKAEVQRQQESIRKRALAAHATDKEVATETVRDSILAILGQRALEQSNVWIGLDGDWNSDATEYRVKVSGTVQLQVADFLRLLERV